MTVMKLRTSVSVVCDTAECHQDILGPTETDAFSSAALVGWRLGDKCGGPHHCPECSAGRVPTQTIRNAVEAAGTLGVRLDRQTAVGESVYDPAGNVLGVAKQAGAMGEMVEFTPSKETLEKMTGANLRDQDTDQATPAPAQPGDEPVEDADSIFGKVDNMFGVGSWNPDD